MSRFCSVNHQPLGRNCQFSHLRAGQNSNSDLRGGEQVLLPLHNCGDLNNTTYENFHQQHNVVSAFILRNLNGMSDCMVVEILNIRKINYKPQNTKEMMVADLADLYCLIAIRQLKMCHNAGLSHLDSLVISQEII